MFVHDCFLKAVLAVQEQIGQSLFESLYNKPLSANHNKLFAKLFLKQPV